MPPSRVVRHRDAITGHQPAPAVDEAHAEHLERLATDPDYRAEVRAAERWAA